MLNLFTQLNSDEKHCVAINSVQGIKLTEIAKSYGTPLYIYDCAILQQNYNKLRAAFPECVHIFYSLKANPNLAVVSQFCKFNACAEVCSLMELELALAAGFLPENIIFLGPAKNRAEIIRCLEVGIYAVVCESCRELAMISEIAVSRKQVARVALRINPSFVALDAILKMGGRASQFGIDQDELLREEKFFLNIPAVKLVGIHIYNGTRILDCNTIVENTRKVLQLSQMLSQRWGIQWEMVDVGGGFGVPYFEGEKILDLNTMQQLLTPIFEEYIKAYPGTRIIIESGRYLVAESGLFLARILDVKKSKGEAFVITDGGTNCFMAAVGIGSLVKRNFPIILVKNNSDTQLTRIEKKDIDVNLYNITGPLCTPGDLIARQVALKDPRIGDLIAIGCAGAYGLTASPVFFLSHGWPAEVIIKNRMPHLIRKRMVAADLLSFQYNNFGDQNK